MTTRLRLTISCACAALTVLSFAVFARSVREDAERARAEAIAAYGGETVELVVATRTMEAGEVPSSADVRTSEWIADLVPEGALTDVSDAVGIALSAPIAKGAPFTSLNFRGAAAAEDVPKGYVAVTIPVNDKLGISREIVVGAKVVAYRVAEGRAEVIAPEAIVLSSPAAYGTALSVSQTMTLAVLPGSVSDVLLASSDASLRIVLPAQGLSMETEGASQAPTEVDASVESEGSVPDPIHGEDLPADQGGSSIDTRVEEEGLDG